MACLEVHLRTSSLPSRFWGFSEGANGCVFNLSIPVESPVVLCEPVGLPAFGQLSTTDLTMAYRANMVSDLPSPQMSKEVSLWLTA